MCLLLLGKNDTSETFLIPTNSPQNLIQGRSRHAEVESEVKSCEFLYPEAKIKGNHPKKIDVLIG